MHHRLKYKQKTYRQKKNRRISLGSPARQVKRQATEREKTYANHTFKELVQTM